MKFSPSLKLALALTLSMTAASAFANSASEIPYDCEVTNMRDSLIQKAYDYTFGLDDIQQEAETNLNWLSVGDKFEMALNVEKLIKYEPNTEELQMRLVVRENTCKGGVVETVKELDFYRRMKKHDKPTLEERSVEYNEMYSSYMDLKINGNKISGKVRLNASGAFNMESCMVNTYPSVIVKFSCTKR